MILHVLLFCVCFPESSFFFKLDSGCPLLPLCVQWGRRPNQSEPNLRPLVAQKRSAAANAAGQRCPEVTEALPYWPFENHDTYHCYFTIVT